MIENNNKCGRVICEPGKGSWIQTSGMDLIKLNSSIIYNRYIQKRMIWDLDLNFLEPRLKKEYPTLFSNSKITKKAIIEFKRHLIMMAHIGKYIKPSLIIGCVWGEYILYTSRYTYECNRIFGFYVDFSPNINIPQKSEMLKIHKLYKRLFNIKPGKIWYYYTGWAPQTGGRPVSVPSAMKKPSCWCTTDPDCCTPPREVLHCW